MNRRMTRFARAGGSSLRGSSAPSCANGDAARAMDSPTRPANASMPNPLPMRQSASLRVSGRAALCAISVDEQEFVRAQKNLDVPAPLGRLQQLLLVGLRRPRPHAGHHPHIVLVRPGLVVSAFWIALGDGRFRVL